MGFRGFGSSHSYLIFFVFGLNKTFTADRKKPRLLKRTLALHIAIHRPTEGNLMPIEHELRALAKTYSEKLSKQIDARVAEMEEDD